MDIIEKQSQITVRIIMGSYSHASLQNMKMRSCMEFDPAYVGSYGRAGVRLIFQEFRGRVPTLVVMVGVTRGLVEQTSMTPNSGQQRLGMPPRLCRQPRFSLL